MLRTTAAITDFQNDAVYMGLPRTAGFTVDIRTIREDSPADMVEYIRRLVSDLDVEVRVLSKCEPSGVSSVRGEAYHALKHAVSSVFGEIEVAPCVMPGVNRRAALRENMPVCFEVFPVVVSSSEFGRSFGANEAIKYNSLGQGVLFYYELIKEFNREQPKR
jgi:carboxypeptidase PM20D1